MHHARHQAAQAADDVAGVKAGSSRPTSGCRPPRSRAEQAAERYNGARWQLQQARRDARVADRHAASPPPMRRSSGTRTPRPW